MARSLLPNPAPHNACPPSRPLPSAVGWRRAPGEAALLAVAPYPTPASEWNYYSTTVVTNDGSAVPPTDYHQASQDRRAAFSLPDGACPSPDSDGLMAVVQPDGWVLDVYAGVVTSDHFVVGTMASWIDARGDGTGWWNGRPASMLPSFAGLIRNGEISAGRIPHALAALAPPALLTHAAVWPAYAFDGDAVYGGARWARCSPSPPASTSPRSDCRRTD